MVCDTFDQKPGCSGDIAAHYQMDWYNMSDDRLAAMKTAAPMLVYIKRDIHGLRHLLHIIEKDSVATPDQRAPLEPSHPEVWHHGPAYSKSHT